MSDYIPISKPTIGEAERAAVDAVLRSGMLAQGRRVKEFEKIFADLVGARYGVAVGNGTQALHLALLAAGVGPGDEVITTPFTFAATATSILMCGARPAFVDVEEDTGNVNTGDMITASIGDIRAVLPVHLYGHPCYPDTLCFSGKPIVWDACQAHGAAVGDYKMGELGLSCWSFYATKNLTTGEGGMVTTNDDETVALLRSLRNHGQSAIGGYDYERFGYNYRMTEIQAAIGLAQVKRFPEFHAIRSNIAHDYGHALRSDGAIIKPLVRPGCVHAWHQYTIRVLDGKRDDLLGHLHNNGIGARAYYPTPLHKTALFVGLGYGDQSFPVAEKLAREVLSLPIGPWMTMSDVGRVVKAVNRWMP